MRSIVMIHSFRPIENDILSSILTAYNAQLSTNQSRTMVANHYLIDFEIALHLYIVILCHA